jgi:type I restriction enzyme S subunit
VSHFPTSTLASIIATSRKQAQPKVPDTVWNLNLDQIESHSGRVISKNIVKTSDLGPSTYAFEQRTVLYSKLRPYLNKVVVADQDGFATTELVPLRCDTSKATPEYISHFLRSPDFLRFATNVVAGAKMPRMVMSEFWKFPVPLPDLSEQRRIAAILDQADALRAKRREALAELDGLAQAIFVEMFGDPTTNPYGFQKKTLGEIIKFEGGAQPPAATFSDTAGEDKIRLVQIRDFKSDRFMTFIPRNLARRFFDVDDVMIGRYGPPVFQILRGLSGSYNVALMKAAPRENVTKDFIYYLLREKRLHDFVVTNSERTAGQSGVNLDLLEKYEAYLPPLNLQEKFFTRIQVVKSLQTAQRTALTELDALFASLQHRAFRGEL